MSDKKLSIVVPVFNKFNFTKSCLADLTKLTKDHEIIIVDNASSDETQVSLEGNTEIVYYRNKENLGFAKACNIGYALSTAPNVLFLNNDIRVKSNHEDWTAPLLKMCPYALVGPTMGQLDNNLSFVQEANRFLPGKSYMSGWCLASSKEIFGKLALPRHNSLIVTDAWTPADGPQIFSEEFGLAYFEDTDLSFRARKQGIKMEVVDVPVVHFGKQTSKQLNTYQLYSAARQIFIKKWGNQ
jgi:GT2 family glycosyltransferase